MIRKNFLSKLIDYTIFFSLILFFSNNFIQIALGYITLPFLFVPIEALCKKLWRGTLGEKIVGNTAKNHTSFSTEIKKSLKKAMLIFPLLFPPINLFFALYYLKEDDLAKRQRWGQSESKDPRKNRTPFRAYFVLTLSVICMTVIGYPKLLNNNLNSQKEIRIENWTKVENSNLNFSVHFPEKPESKNLTVEVKEQKTHLDVTELFYKSKQNTDYFLQCSKVPSTWTFLGSKYLINKFTDALSEHEGTVSEKNFSKHYGKPCMHYLLKNKNGGQTKGLIVLSNYKIFRVEIQGKTPSLSEEDLIAGKNFIDSFSPK